MTFNCCFCLQLLLQISFHLRFTQSLISFHWKVLNTWLNHRYSQKCWHQWGILAVKILPLWRQETLKKLANKGWNQWRQFFASTISLHETHDFSSTERIDSSQVFELFKREKKTEMNQHFEWLELKCEFTCYFFKFLTIPNLPGCRVLWHVSCLWRHFFLWSWKFLTPLFRLP